LSVSDKGSGEFEADVDGDGKTDMNIEAMSDGGVKLEIDMEDIKDAVENLTSMSSSSSD